MLVGDDCFPNGLKKMNTGNIPAVLFYKGNYKLLQNKCVGLLVPEKYLIQE